MYFICLFYYSLLKNQFYVNHSIDINTRVGEFRIAELGCNCYFKLFEIYFILVEKLIIDNNKLIDNLEVAEVSEIEMNKKNDVVQENERTQSKE